MAAWLAGDPPNRANHRNVSEISRLFHALAEVVPASQSGPWLDIPNPAFEGSTPLQVIERGESDRELIREDQKKKLTCDALSRMPGYRLAPLRGNTPCPRREDAVDQGL